MHQTSRANRTTPPYPHTCQDCHVGPNPAVFLNHNVPAKRRSLSSMSPPRIDGICRANQLDIGAENTPRSDRDAASVRDAAVGADEYVVAHSNVVAVVAVEGGFDYAVIAYAAEESRAYICGRRVTKRNRWLRGGPQGENLAEQTDALFWTNAVRGVGSIIEAPDGLDTIFAILDQHRMVGHIV